MKIILLSTFLLFSVSCFSQHKLDTLIDKSTRIIYFLDSSRRCVIAKDSNNKQIWKTDIFDTKVMKTLSARPMSGIDNKTKIAYINFMTDDYYCKEFVGCYFYLCAGYLNKENGQYHFFGCD